MGQSLSIKYKTYLLSLPLYCLQLLRALFHSLIRGLMSYNFLLLVSNFIIWCDMFSLHLSSAKISYIWFSIEWITSLNSIDCIKVWESVYITKCLSFLTYTIFRAVLNSLSFFKILLVITNVLHKHHSKNIFYHI